ncbi:MAG: cysteine hydrolase family protein, partial [Candidatus Hadarchaeales archaeon]
IDLLAPAKGEVVLEKHTYSAFFSTGLEEVLRKKGVREVVIGGVVTNICIQHTAADAFFRGFNVTILKDCTAAVDGKTHRDSLEYMKKMYGAKIISAKEFIREVEG